MSYELTDLEALEILDSRGRPTLEVTARLSGGRHGAATGVFGVPAGASTGGAEAVEHRDGDADRYGGQGVREAVASVGGEIRGAVCGRMVGSIGDLDRLLIDLDGTADRHRLGANAIVGVSVAAARAMAAAEGEPLWHWISASGFAPRLPVPHFNVVNGGAHAGNRLAFQEFMIAPLGAPDVAEAVRAGSEIYAALRRALQARGEETGIGDEGGFAPGIDRPDEVLDLLVEATRAAGYEPGPGGVAFALDPAANGFQVGPGRYRLGDEEISSRQLVDYYETLVERYPIWSIEDGLAEDDNDGWIEITRRLGGRIQIVGDDNFVTNSAVMAAAHDKGIANAALLKVNQVGTLSETLDAARLAASFGWGAMVSHRSGETVDTFPADLAVGIGCGQLKSGAPARGERLAKYNQLLRIAATSDLPYGLVPRPGA